MVVMVLLQEKKELRAKSPHLVKLSRVVLLGVALPLKVNKESQQWQESNLLAKRGTGSKPVEFSDSRTPYGARGDRTPAIRVGAGYTTTML